ncbi:MAG: molybdopterin-guanine dinucleotide biosynthesis protein B [Dehalococcoidia bacterium]|jgi:molybdopterin-guanine dinucleotide biosynthesis protein MobB|nr:molybdopterin-guanine dinucleotide biosynthesis protein B [Dehalococcoidia bacterium]
MTDPRHPVPAIRLAGWSGAGKTWFGVRLVAELRERGLRVGVLKHAIRHPAPPDGTGKDTTRYREAGAAAVGGLFEDEAVLRLPSDAADLDSLLAITAPAVDLVLIEGFHDADLPTVLIHRNGTELRLPGHGEVLAVVSDDRRVEQNPRYASDDVSGIADLIERWLEGAAANGGA